jgi:hypothetical protein
MILCLGLLFGICMLAKVASSQESRATLTGTITDPQGAVLPGAKIDVKNAQTNVASSTVANSTGLYALPSLNPGVYDVTVSASSFKTAVQNNVNLQVGGRLELNFKLELGSISETVEVTGMTPMLETATASQGTVINQDAITSLPMLNNNVFTLMKLTVGAVNTGGITTSSSTPWAVGDLSNYNINGSDGFNAEYVLDGSPNTNRSRGTSSQDANIISSVPPADSIGEFKTQTTTYDAEYGRNSGGVINVSLKSGTNKLHGSLYEFFRNDVLNANKAENKAAKPIIDRPAVRWNQPGGSITGPVIKDKMFFMFSYEAIRQHVPSAQSLVVPTALERQGDFSQTLDPKGKPIKIYDPKTTHKDASGKWVRDLFPLKDPSNPGSGYVIPSDRLDKVAVNIMKYMPMPNLSGTARGVNNLVVSPNMVVNTYNAIATRIDYTLNSKNNIYATFNHDDYHQTGGTEPFDLAAASRASETKRYDNSVTINFTSVISTNFISNSRINYGRNTSQAIPYAYGYDPTPLGFSSSLVSKLRELSFPSITLSGYASLGNTGKTSAISNTWTFGQTLSTVFRTHSVKYGLEFRQMLDNRTSPSSSFGSFSFNTLFTGSDSKNANTDSGDGVASFILGYAASGSVPINGDFAYAHRYWGLFVQDDWRISTRLTLNLGLRWDYESPSSERYNRLIAGFDTTTPYTLANSNIGFKGGLIFANSINRFGYEPDKNNIQPRFGLAYKITDKLVFRGGYGIQSSPQLELPPSTGYNATTTMVTSLDDGLTPTDVLSNPYPNGINLPTGSSLGLATYLGQNISYYSSNRETPLHQGFTAGIQYEFPFKMVLGVTYAGERMNHHQLMTAYYVNAIRTAQWVALGDSAGDQVANPYQGLLPGSTLNGPTISREQLLKPYPQFGTISETAATIGKRWYDAMQVQFEKRMSKGLMVMLNYTFGKSLGQLEYLNNGRDDPDQLTKSIIPPDRNHITNLAASYVLPFGANTAGVARQLLYGWNLSTTITYQSGQPLGPISSMDWTGAQVKIDNPTMARYFNTCNLDLSGKRQKCASDSEPIAWNILGTYGAKSIRKNPTLLDQLRGPAVPFKAGVNLAFFKEFKITESSKLALRGEFFNLFNTPAFTSLNTNPTRATFGTINFTQSNESRQGQLSLRYIF